jgi:hypothetical protein
MKLMVKLCTDNNRCKTETWKEWSTTELNVHCGGEGPHWVVMPSKKKKKKKEEEEEQKKKKKKKKFPGDRESEKMVN